MMTRLEAAYKTIEIAERKEREGDLRRAHMCYEGAINDFMHLSFKDYSDTKSLKEWLSQHPLEIVVTRYVTLTEQVLAMPEAQWTGYFGGGNYLMIAFSHFFAALGQIGRARYFAELGATPVFFSTPYWGEYGKTYWAMVDGHDYAPTFGKPKGEERYWSAYVDCMLAFMREGDVAAALAHIDAQFIKRNLDMKLLYEDAYMIDGTGDVPMKFDFRKAGLLAIMSYV